ncbi:MAG TPA: type VI secretion system baseplate subunit TssG [Telluria sp.]|nr:type VI secretion system baseplate subunit TssG [Telluria sp.]
MHASKRRFEPAVIERLFREPYRFGHFQAVSLLELWFKRQGIPRQRAANHLRFQNSTSLRFAPSEIEAIAHEAEEAAPGRVRMTPAFMGLLGANGSLPAHYTERVAEYVHAHKDEGPRAFLDVFSNRSLALFYEAWRKYRLELKYHLDGSDSFLPLLLSLAGLGQRSLRRRAGGAEDGAVLDESLGYFAASVRHRPASAVQMARVLAEYFRQPVRAEQFVGNWYAVPETQQTTIGCANCELGAGAMAGERVWQRDLRLRLVIGPLDHASYAGFLPGGAAARAMKSVLAMLTGVSLEYEIELVLLAPEVRGLSLVEARQGGCLGWDTWLATEPQAHDRNDVRYEIQAL